MRLLALRTILVASDLTPTSDVATRTALDLSRASGAALHVVHVPTDDADLDADGEHRARNLGELDIALGRMRAGEHDFAMHVANGEAPSAIARIADELDADVVILGRRRMDEAVMPNRPLGGTAYAVMSRSRAPCLAITEPLEIPIRRAVVAIDRSATARGALLVALSWVSALRADAPGGEHPTLTALYVDPGESDREAANAVGEKTIEHELDILRRNAEAWAGVTVVGETVEGRDPAPLIASYARDHGAQLVVLGTRAPEHREPGLGSVSASVTARTSIPVLLVPPAVWRDHAKDIDYF
jgi:nucleotide-binding universal stress UspA family protein